MAQQDYRGGRALLVAASGKCHLVLTRRIGPLWREFGSATCMFDDPAHPFSWTGRHSCTTGAKYCVEAVGGTFKESRIAKIRVAEELFDVAGTGRFLFARAVEKLGNFPAMQALDAEGNVLFEANERTNFEWRAPSAP